MSRLCLQPMELHSMWTDWPYVGPNNFDFVGNIAQFAFFNYSLPKQRILLCPGFLFSKYDLPIMIDEIKQTQRT